MFIALLQYEFSQKIKKIRRRCICGPKTSPVSDTKQIANSGSNAYYFSHLIYMEVNIVVQGLLLGRIKRGKDRDWLRHKYADPNLYRTTRDFKIMMTGGLEFRISKLSDSPM